MLMLYLLLELCSVLVETFGRVPQSQKARVGRPLKWAQSDCLLPHFRRKPFSTITFRLTLVTLRTFGESGLNVQSGYSEDLDFG